MSIEIKDINFFENKENVEKLIRKCHEYLEDSHDFSFHAIEIFDNENPKELSFYLIRAIRYNGFSYDVYDFEYNETDKFVNKWFVNIHKSVVDTAVEVLNSDSIDLLTEVEFDSLKDYGHVDDFLFIDEYSAEDLPEDWH